MITNGQENKGCLANTPNSSPIPSKKRKVVDIPGNITVEEYLNLQCDALVEQLNTHAHELQDKLRSEYQSLTKSYLERVDVTSNEPEQEGVQPAGQVFNIVATTGPHKDKVFIITVSAGTPALIGRSRGRKFVKGEGISLFKDQEVSTTHGKFEFDTTLTFVDVGSTNGSLMNGKALEPNEVVKFSHGDSLTIGQTVFKLQHTE